MLLQNKHQQTKISLSELSDKEILKLILNFMIIKSMKK